jgi:hypothetical protein
LGAISNTIDASTSGGSLKSPKRDSQSGRLLSSIRSTSKGTPWNLIATQSASKEGLLKAMSADTVACPELHAVASQHGHVEIYIMYLAVNEGEPIIIPDG